MMTGAMERRNVVTTMPERKAAKSRSSGATSVPWSVYATAVRAPAPTRIARVESRRNRKAIGRAATAAPSEALDRICPIPASFNPSSRR